MPNEVRVAVLGCGKQAPKHIKGLRSAPGVQIVLADIRPEFARNLAEQENLPWVSSLDEVFADPGIHAVDICTPTPSHPELILAAIRNGKDYFCEKPLSESSAIARQVADATRQSRNIGMVMSS